MMVEIKNSDGNVVLSTAKPTMVGTVLKLEKAFIPFMFDGKYTVHFDGTFLHRLEIRAGKLWYRG